MHEKKMKENMKNTWIHNMSPNKGLLLIPRNVHIRTFFASYKFKINFVNIMSKYIQPERL